MNKTVSANELCKLYFLIFYGVVLSKVSGPLTKALKILGALQFSLRREVGKSYVG